MSAKDDEKISREDLTQRQDVQAIIQNCCGNIIEGFEILRATQNNFVIHFGFVILFEYQYCFALFSREIALENNSRIR